MQPDLHRSMRAVQLDSITSPIGIEAAAERLTLRISQQDESGNETTNVPSQIVRHLRSDGRGRGARHMNPKIIALSFLASCVVTAGAQDLTARRSAMVRYIQASGVTNQRVLDSLKATPRHEFVPAAVRQRAYLDVALPIGYGQTISSPYIVARMTEQLNPQPTDRVLEVGTGSGYQAAVLSPLVSEVYSIEIVPELGASAAATLESLKYSNVQLRIGDGYQGWPEHAPFDKIIVTCSPENIPTPLVQQLAEGGHLVIPVGQRFQQILYRFTKHQGHLRRERVESTFFVPMTGQAEAERQHDVNEKIPSIVNGGFESHTKQGEPTGWFYVRGGKVRRDPTSREKLHCIEFEQPGNRPAHALQPVGIDGSAVKKLRLQFWSRGEGLRMALLAVQPAQLRIEFYDEQRRLCGEEAILVSSGTFPWKRHDAIVDVPDEAKLAMVQLGLFGVSGKLWFDDVQLAAANGDSSPKGSKN